MYFRWLVQARQVNARDTYMAVPKPKTNETGDWYLWTARLDVCVVRRLRSDPFFACVKLPADFVWHGTSEKLPYTSSVWLSCSYRDANVELTAHPGRLVSDLALRSVKSKMIRANTLYCSS